VNPPPRASRPRRIVVVGRAGSGKSTTSIALGLALGLPVVHLDQLYWTSDWHPVGTERFEALHDAAIATEDWVMDGGYMSLPSFGGRVRRADLVVITQAPLPVCLFRVVRRTFRYHGRERPGRPDGADERFSLEFLVWIVRWTWKHRHLEREIRAHDASIPIVVVRRPADLDRVLLG
jgi:adenylate kinase family enzyme